MSNIKNKLMVTTILFGMSNFLYGQVISINKGWQLSGTENGFNNLDEFNKSCINTVWTYDNNNQWNAYSPNISTMSIIENTDINKLYNIPKNNGFWINSNSDCTISTSDNTTSSVVPASSEKVDDKESNSKDYKNIYDLDGVTLNLIYKYSYKGAEYSTLNINIDKLDLVGDKTSAVSTTSPIYVCNDDSDDAIRETVDGGTTYEWEYICMGSENSYSSFYTFFVFNIDEEGKIFGVFEKDTSFSSAYLNIFDNWDGVVVGSVTNNKTILKRKYTKDTDEYLGNILEYIKKDGKEKMR